MLKECRITASQIELVFELKNKGKFRLKELSTIGNPYSRALKQQDIDTGKSWYLEWMISYYVDHDKKLQNTCLLDKETIELKGKKIHPYELPVLYKNALKCGLVDKRKARELLEWVCYVRETLENEFVIIPEKINKTNENIVELNGLKFECVKISLPLLIYKNTDGSWIELFLQKQQMAYNFQPFIFLCILHSAFTQGKSKNDVVWTMEVKTLENLFKVFASASERHREDICKLLSGYIMGE